MLRDMRKDESVEDINLNSKLLRFYSLYKN